MDLRGKRIEEGYTNLVTVEGESVASSGKLQNGQGTDLGNIAVGGLSFNSGDSELQLPAGTTAERPASPSAGYARFNTDKGKVEIYTGAAWLSIALEGAVQLSTATATVTGQDAVAQINTFISQFGTPASAFSVRKLGDTDVCMRVRRSSDNAEQNIGFDGNDLDESALTTFVGANDGFVTTWYDQSVDNSTLPAEHGSGATASYSLRLVDSTYTGDAIRVRRSSDNTEQDIGFVDGELDTSSLETFCSGTNGFVTTWYDQSGSNDATQATAGSQPQIVSSGSTILENGKPVIENATHLNISTISGCTDAFIVHGINSGNDISFGMTGNSGNDFIYIADGDSPVTEINRGVGSPDYYVNGVQQSWSTRSDVESALNSQTTLSVIGGSLEQLDKIGQRSSDTLTSATFYQEVILYNSDQSANRESIELSQASYYDIGVSIGATQSTAGSQPKIVSSGTVIKENSVPALDFDGSDDELIAGDIFDGLTSFYTSSVFKFTDNGNFKGIHTEESGGIGNRSFSLSVDDSSPPKIGLAVETPSFSSVQESTSSSGQNVLITTTYNGSAIELFKDGSSQGTDANSGSTTTNAGKFTIGARRAGVDNADVQFNEIIIYDSDKSSDRTDIESNINDYYGIY